MAVLTEKKISYLAKKGKDNDLKRDGVKKEDVSAYMESEFPGSEKEYADYIICIWETL